MSCHIANPLIGNPFALGNINANIIKLRLVI